MFSLHFVQIFFCQFGFCEIIAVCIRSKKTFIAPPGNDQYHHETSVLSFFQSFQPVTPDIDIDAIISPSTAKQIMPSIQIIQKLLDGTFCVRVMQNINHIVHGSKDLTTRKICTKMLLGGE